jgi:squalene-hopene/tetraprenyl-beta-curcumene cyclase
MNNPKHKMKTLILCLLSPFVIFSTALLLAAPAVQAQESKAAPAPEAVVASEPAFPQGSPDEPLLKVLSLAKAAESLDRTAVAWVQKNKCGSCHTGWPYLMSRAVLKDEPSTGLAELRKFFEGRITNWDADEQVKKHQHREIVGTSTALAIHDAQTSGKLQPVTREALDRMWTLQRKDGAWSWPKCSWPPFEIDDYYGAVLAAVGVGHAPGNYAHGDSAKAGVEKLRAYFKHTAPPSLHHKAWLLWASVRLDGLLSANEQQAAIKELLALQRSDGGWSMESLGKGWVGRDGEEANPDAPSDGYGTGLVVFVLRQAGVPAGEESIRRGKAWLSTNQRESGRWFTRSLNGVKQHYISDTATVFAVLALDACK